MIKARVHGIDFDMRVDVVIYQGPDQARPGDVFCRYEFDGKLFKTVNIDPNEEGQRIEPTFSMPEYMARALYLGLEEHYERVGKPSKPTSYTQGELEATKKHLEDMRALVLP